MRRSIVCLIARRELRDLARDRRTLFIVFLLPALMYPAFGLVGVLWAITMLEQKVIVGIAGIEQLPPVQTHPESIVGGSLYALECQRRFDDPPLIADGRFLPSYAQSEADFSQLVIKPVDSNDEALLRSREVDVLLTIPPDFQEKLRRGERPTVEILGRQGDETSKLSVRKVGGIINRWQQRIKEVRFARQGLPVDFDQPLEIVDPQESKPSADKTIDELRDQLAKFFPFLLVMWTMAGALHPAIDLTAGEKERGTMETLLISPAERGEIVAGKFLAVWLFSFFSALCNIFWMGGAALVLGWFLPSPIMSMAGLVWSTLFAIPLAALFSGVAIGLGVFARSSKEGQYYLMPLFLLTMPLCLWSMTPGLKFTFALSLVPLTGLALMLQRLMTVGGEPLLWFHVVGVIGSLFICVALTLWWAAWQFHRESVLFREAERLSLFGWLRSFGAKRT